MSKLHTKFAVPFLATVLSSFGVQAAESCAEKTALLISNERVDALSALFISSSLATKAQLSEFAYFAGRLSKITQANNSRFDNFTRYTVKGNGTPTNYTFTGQLVYAESEKHGPVQIKVHIKPGTKCSLLAIDFDMKPLEPISSIQQPHLLFKPTPEKASILSLNPFHS
jgi:hypothetical protein